MTTTSPIQTIQMKDVLAEIGAYGSSLKKNVFTAFWVGLLLSALAMGYYFWQKPSFQAEASFILEEKTSGGSLAGLASQFGFDIGSLSGGTGIFAGDNILDIIKSRTLVEKVLLTTVNEPGIKPVKLIDQYINTHRLRKKWKAVPGMDTLQFAHYQKGDRLKDSLLTEVYELVVKNNLQVDRQNKKGSIIKVQLTSHDPVFSKNFAERIVQETISFYVNIKTSVANRNIERLEKKADSLLSILNTKSYQTASQQILDANIAYKAATVPSELTQREKTLSYALYTEVTKNLEASRMTLASQTPIINLLDMPRYPLADGRTAWFLLLAGVWALVIAGTLILSFLTYKSPK